MTNAAAKRANPTPKKKFNKPARAPKPNKLEDKLTKQLEDQSPQNSDDEEDEDEVQCLTVKIALGGKEHEINLYKDSDPEEIGKEFAQTQNLSEAKT